MEIRRFRIIAGAESKALDAEFNRKRQRLECSVSPPAVLQKGFGSEEEGAGEGKVSESNLNGRSSSPGLPGESTLELGPFDRCARYGVTSVCGRRRDMEDAVSVHPDFLRRFSGTRKRYNFFGVFDGHGCSHVKS